MPWTNPSSLCPWRRGQKGLQTQGAIEASFEQTGERLEALKEPVEKCKDKEGRTVK